MERRLAPDDLVDSAASPFERVVICAVLFAAIAINIFTVIGLAVAGQRIDGAPHAMIATAALCAGLLVWVLWRWRGSRAAHSVGPVSRSSHELDEFATRRRFAARIAHDINNPLGGIQNAFLLIRDAIPATHQHFRYVAAIEQEIQRIVAITRQLYETDLDRPEFMPAPPVTATVPVATTPADQLKPVVGETSS